MSNFHPRKDSQIPFGRAKPFYKRLGLTPFFLHQHRNGYQNFVVTLGVLNILNPLEDINKQPIYKNEENISISLGNITKLTEKEIIRKRLSVLACPGGIKDLATDEIYKNLQEGKYKYGINIGKYGKKQVECPVCEGTGTTTVWTEIPVQDQQNTEKENN
jgi:hypothetical protein